MEGYLEFGFFVSFVTMVVLINAAAICFIRGSMKWKKVLQWALVPIAFVCICIIAYP
ncbi:MAG: hypothetical protein ACI35P_09245 [Bacillus sp. (in: firmicutes)]